MSQHNHSTKTRGMGQSEMPGWIIPLTYSVIAILLAWAVPRIEASVFPEWTSPMTVSAAIAIYSAVATGMIALTGIVFSLVFVMVQFSATAYSPRLVLWMARDPLLFHAMGVFSATSLYAIGALAWVDRRHDQKVPFISVWLTIGLLMASVVVFMRLVQRLNRLQVDRALGFTADFGRRVIELIYPPMETSQP